MSSNISANVIVYRCPTCNDQVIIVPPGFEPPSDEEVETKAAAHMKKHDEIQKLVEGPGDDA